MATLIHTQNIYHLGATLKDLGNKVFAFSKMDINSFEILGKIQISDDKKAIK